MFRRTVIILAILILCLNLVAYAQKSNGRLAVCKVQVTLRASRNSYSYAFSSVPAGTCLVVARVRGKWAGVVMQDGRIGWSPLASFQLTDYQVVYNGGWQVKGSRSPVTTSGNSVTSLALKYLGVRYVWGGNTPEQGMDCSGYVKNVFGKLGVKLPRRATHQMAVGQVISRYEDLKPGDRLYFSDRKHTRISHTGIYLGKGYFIHANSSAKKVSISYLITKRWMSICVAARR